MSARSLCWLSGVLLAGCVAPEPARTVPTSAPPPAAEPPSDEPAPTAPDEPPEQVSGLVQGDAEEFARSGAEETDSLQDAEAEARAPAAAPPGESPADGEPPAGGILHGSLSVRYRGRFTGDDQDHDLRSILALDLVDPRAPWISGHVLARVDGDLDGNDDGEVFEDLSDTYESVYGKLYLAYADLALGSAPGDAAGSLRIGRQNDLLLPEVVRLDGVSYVTGPLGKGEVELGLYGGIPVHLYDSSREGDVAFGTFAEGRPWTGGRTRFDWMHLEDELRLGEHKDDLLALSLWQTLAERWRFEGAFSRLESSNRDLRLRALFDDPVSYVQVRANYYQLFETQAVHVTELDPFTSEVEEYFPFRQVGLDLSHPLSEHTRLDAGYELRRVTDSGDVGEFNRDWARAHVTVALNDVPVEGIAFNLTGERWNDDGRDVEAIAGDVAYDAAGGWRTSLGTYWSMYKYHLLELDEREDVRTYFLSASRELSTRVRVDIAYELEDDDFDVYQTVRGGITWRF